MSTTIEYPEWEEENDPVVVRVDFGEAWNPSWKASSQALAFKVLMNQFNLIRFESDSGSGYVCAHVYDDDTNDLEKRVIAAVEAVFDSAGRE